MNKTCRETLCSNCIHLNVCKFKEHYLEVVDEINKIEVEQWIVKEDPKCSLYHSCFIPTPKKERDIKPITKEVFMG